MLFYPLPSTKVKGTPPPPMWRSREGVRMKSNLQGRRDDRKGGFAPSPNTAKLPAGAAVRRSYPRTGIDRDFTSRSYPNAHDRRYLRFGASRRGEQEALRRARRVESERGHPCSTTQETWVALCVLLIRPGGCTTLTAETPAFG